VPRDRYVAWLRDARELDVRLRRERRPVARLLAWTGDGSAQGR